MEFSPFLYIPWLQICSPLYCDRLFLTHGIWEDSRLIKQRIKHQFPTHSKHTVSIKLVSHLILCSEVIAIYLHGGTKRINTPWGQNAGLWNKGPTWCHLLFYFTSCVLNMFRILIYPSSGACDCAVELPQLSFCSRFVVCWRFGGAGLEWCPCCRLKLSCAAACNTDTIQTQPHQIPNTQRTENKTTAVVIQQHSRQLLMMDILMSETCWAHKKWNKIASDIKLVFYSSTITMMHGPINIKNAGYQNGRHVTKGAQ